MTIITQIIIEAELVTLMEGMLCFKYVGCLKKLILYSTGNNLATIYYFSNTLISNVANLAYKKQKCSHCPIYSHEPNLKSV